MSALMRMTPKYRDSHNVSGLAPAAVRSLEEEVKMFMASLDRLNGAHELAKYEMLLTLLHLDHRLFFAVVRDLHCSSCCLC